MRTVHLTHPLAPSESESVFPPSGQVLAIGFFDGVHLGHQEVIQRALYHAKYEHIPASILTFSPHPREVLGQLRDPKLITPLEDKLALFADFGIDTTYVLKFDRALSQLSAEAFVNEVLGRMKLHTVLVGFNFTFGRLGKGDVRQLREWSAGKFKLSVVQPFHHGDHRVSSTLIREKLFSGDVVKVAELLGRPYALKGRVVQGDGRGRTIGFPTANLQLERPYHVPGKGVYAVRVRVDGARCRGVMNIGVKPTFSEKREAPTLEVHIMDYEGDLYGREIEVQFIAFLRAETKFASVEELVGQIGRDVEQARKWLND